MIFRACVGSYPVERVGYGELLFHGAQALEAMNERVPAHRGAAIALAHAAAADPEPAWKGPAKSLLEILVMYNIHYSLLPRWRGATPVEAAILAGDVETGVVIQKIVHELDAGPIVAVEKTEIGADETGVALRSRLNYIAKKLLVRILPEILAGNMKLVEQDKTRATFCGKISKEDGLLDFSDGGELNYRKFRAYFGWPGVCTFFERSGKRIRTIIVKAHKDGAQFVIDIVKPEGKGEMPYEDFVRSGAKVAR